ncbi:MAG: penicillin-binding protein activator LpoB [Victivallales bacterium]|nr:penicillin-binding protein activator LpoB [Victivallales bacterium]
MKTCLSALLAIAIAILFTGCGPTVEVVDTSHDSGAAVAGMEYRDFDYAAGNMVASMIDSGCLNRKDGGRYVVAISRVKNDTTQYIDTDQLIKKIRIDMLRSGKATITTAVAGNGPEDAMSKQVRQLRADADFNQATVAGQGTMVAPDLSLSGKILERQISGGGRKVQIEYYFQLTLTDVNTGLAIWEDEQLVVKRVK